MQKKLLRRTVILAGIAFFAACSKQETPVIPPLASQDSVLTDFSPSASVAEDLEFWASYISPLKTLLQDSWSDTEYSALIPQSETVRMFLVLDDILRAGNAGDQFYREYNPESAPAEVIDTILGNYLPFSPLQLHDEIIRYNYNPVTDTYSYKSFYLSGFGGVPIWSAATAVRENADNVFVDYVMYMETSRPEAELGTGTVTIDKITDGKFRVKSVEWTPKPSLPSHTSEIPAEEG